MKVETCSLISERPRLSGGERRLLDLRLHLRLALALRLRQRGGEGGRRPRPGRTSRRAWPGSPSAGRPPGPRRRRPARRRCRDQLLRPGGAASAGRRAAGARRSRAAATGRRRSRAAGGAPWLSTEDERHRARTRRVGEPVHGRADVGVVDVGLGRDQGDDRGRVVGEVRRRDRRAGLVGVDRPAGLAACRRAPGCPGTARCRRAPVARCCSARRGEVVGHGHLGDRRPPGRGRRRRCSSSRARPAPSSGRPRPRGPTPT